MFNRQFVVASRPLIVADGWRQHTIARSVLHTAPDLPVVRIVCSRGSGLVLGWPIHQGRLFDEKDVLFYEDDPSEIPFAGLSGRFVALVEERDGLKCYLDPCGYLPLVYCPAQRMVASTTGLIPRDKGSRDDIDLVAALGIPANDNWFPFGLTSRVDVRRLLPNHALDLATFETTRYWPVEAPATTIDDRTTSSKVEEIAWRLQQNVAALAAHGELICHLTAGRDSRTLLASARNLVDGFRFVTFRLPDRTAIDDCNVAAALATRFGLRHNEVECSTATEADLENWLHDTGRCVAGRTWRLATTWKNISPRTKFSLTGLGGELGRAVDWQESDDARGTIPTDELLARLGLRLARVPHSMARAGEAWRAGLGPLSLSLLLDFGMMELWIPCYAAPSFYGHCHADVSISPFNDRKILSLMLSLPLEYRSEQRLTTDLLDLMWPELNEFPFNPEAERLRARWLQERALAATAGSA